MSFSEKTPLSVNCDPVQTAKLVLLGATSVGKSSIVCRFTRNVFANDHVLTIGAAFSSKTVRVQGEGIRLNIWDTGGEEKYHSLSGMFYRDAKAAVIVYDITDAASLRSALEWTDELRDHEKERIVIVLVGNKLDMAPTQRAVNAEHGRSVAEKSGMMFTEVSAKTGFGVEEMFDTIAWALASNITCRADLQTKHDVTLEGKKLLPSRCCSQCCSC